MSHTLEERSQRAAAEARRWGEARAERRGSEVLALVQDEAGRAVRDERQGLGRRALLIGAAAVIVALGGLAIVSLRPGSADAPASVTDTAALPESTTPLSITDESIEPDATAPVAGTEVVPVLTDDGAVVASCDDVGLVSPVDDVIEPFTVRSGTTELGGVWISIDDAHNRRMTSVCADNEPLTPGGVDAQLAWPAGDDVYIAVVEPVVVDHAPPSEWFNSIGRYPLSPIHSLAVIGRISSDTILPEVPDIDSPAAERERQLIAKVEQVRELHNYVNAGPDAVQELDSLGLSGLLPPIDAPDAGATIDASLVLSGAQPGQQIEVRHGDDTIGADTICVRFIDPDDASGAACSETAAAVGLLIGLQISNTTPQDSTMYIAHSNLVSIHSEQCEIRTAPITAGTDISACALGDFAGDLHLVLSGATTYATDVLVPDLDAYESPTTVAPTASPEPTMYRPEPVRTGEVVTASVVPAVGVTLEGSTVTFQIVELPDGRFLQVDRRGAVVPEGATFWTTNINGRLKAKSNAIQQGVYGTRIDPEVYGDTFTVSVDAITSTGEILASTGEIEMSEQP